MEYGLIGEHLPHSFSKEIHEKLGRYTYDIVELTPEEVGPFMEKREFKGINVTIPYKKVVIPYLHEMTDRAKAIGAVNTIVNKNGLLYGDNTDFFGMEQMLLRAGLDLKDKKVLILGTGGTALTAKAVARSMQAARVEEVSRHGAEDPSKVEDPANPVISYDCAYALRKDTEVIINTTPVGMFPKADAEPIDLEQFPKLIGVADAIYNPLSTKMVQHAQSKGLIGVCGLYMLVAQAMRAAENFTDEIVDEDMTETIYRSLVKEKQNIVLTGMPASGKSTLGKLLSKMTDRDLVDADAEIVKAAGKPITDIFAEEGEKGFRDLESKVLFDIAAKGGRIIATGGGAILREENVRVLRQNGVIIFNDRPLEQLLPTEDRPTANSPEKIRALYENRMPLYLERCDIKISNDQDAEMAAKAALEAFMSYHSNV